MAIKKTGPISFPKLPATNLDAASTDVATDEAAVETRPTESAVANQVSRPGADQFSSQTVQDAFAQSAVVADAHPAFESARPSSVRRMSSVLERSLEQVTADFAKLSEDVSEVRGELFSQGFSPESLSARGGELGRLRRKARSLRMRQRQLGRRLKFLGADVPRTKLDSQLPTDARPLSRAMSLADNYGDAVAVRFEVNAGQNRAELGTVLAHQSPSAIVTEQALQELGIEVKGERPQSGDLGPASGPLAELLALASD